MNTVDRLQATTEQGTDLGIVHVKVSDADHAFAFHRELLGWQSEPYREGGFTAHYIVNTSVLTVLTDNPDAAPVRLFFPVGDVGAGVRTVEELGGAVTASAIHADGGGWAEADRGQGGAIGRLSVAGAIETISARGHSIMAWSAS